MKAIILSGGMGKRLRPITDYVPKSLVPINHVPIIEWQIRYFKKFGVKEFVVCTSHLANQIIEYLESKDLGVKIQYSVEKNPLGTAGAIKKAMDHLHDSFFVINGDVITNLDLNKLKLFPNSIAVIPLRTTFGIVHVNNNTIERFEEKPEILDYWMNAGLYYLNEEIIQFLPIHGNLENNTFPRMAERKLLHVTKYTKVFWNSIDSYKDMEECDNNIKRTHFEKFLSE